MKKLKSNSGITLLTLSLTIAIMLVLSFTIAININDYMEKEERIKLETDILKLQEKVANYYSKNNSLPIINEYTNTVLLKKNINDNDKYYVIDISKLEKIDLNYGEDYNKIENKETPIGDLFDIYIINEQSHTIYYPKGIQYKGKFYYTTEDKNNTKIEDMQLVGIEITGRSSGKLNEEIQLIANSVPKFIENSGVIWSSSDTNIATVDENGKVTLKAVGTVTITAVLKDNELISKDYEIECYLPEEELKTERYDNPYIPTGFTHIGGTWNSGYTIRGTGEGIAPDEFVWVPCVLTLEEQNKASENGHTVEILKKKTTGKYNENYAELLPENTSVSTEDSSVQEIEQSVAKYGGFYIAKYEAGIEGTTDNYNLSTKKPTNGEYKPLSQQGKGVWNSITRENAITVSKAMIDHEKTGAYSTLISGAAWDTTLQWMINSSDNKTINTGYDINSEGWYSSVAGGRVTTTGYKQVNNIYDMAGNICEWTTENCKNYGYNFLVYRGRQFRKYWF